MDALWKWLAGAELAMLVPLGGYLFKVRADALGWKTSYDREKERNDEYAAAERDAKLAAMMGVKVAEAIGRLPREGDPG